MYRKILLSRSESVDTDNEIYFRELFLAAHFSRKFEKPSDKVLTVHFLLCDDKYCTFRNRNLPRLVHTSNTRWRVGWRNTVRSKFGFVN